MRRLLAELRALWRGLRRPSEVDADMSDEMRFHIEMESRRLQERGLNAEEAARQASIAFGGVEKYRGAGRDAFGFTWMRGMSVDFKLGLRMLAKFRASRRLRCSRCHWRSGPARRTSSSSTI